MNNPKKSRILAASEYLLCLKCVAFFVNQNRLPNPSLPTLRHIKDSLTIIGRGSLLILKTFIMSENQKDPQTPTAVLSRIDAVCPNVERLKQKLDRMYFKSNNPKPCAYTGISYILKQLIEYQNSFKTKQDESK